MLLRLCLGEGIVLVASPPAVHIPCEPVSARSMVFDL